MVTVSMRDSSARAGFPRILASPWLDRAVALVASVPFAWSLRHEFRSFGVDPVWIVANANFVLLVATMLVRRAPTRVTLHPLLWALAFVATYWLFIFGRFADVGISVTPAWLILALTFASAAISVWARLSLGRSIGLVPANRGVVTTGAYGFMRHPIYTGVYLAYAALALQNWSLRNASIFAVGAALFIIKSFVEENFLRQDVEYARYMERVRWRWIPYVI